MKLNNQNMRYNLQFFAEDSENTEQSETDAQEETQESDDNSQESEKTFTQAELEDIIKKRLERERKKVEKGKEKPENDTKTTKIDTKDDNNEKLTALELKVLCYEHGIDKEYSKDALALAKAYVNDDTDIEQALTKVIEKFPMFVKGNTETVEKASWGKRQSAPAKKIDAVEEAFLKRNPNLKID